MRRCCDIVPFLHPLLLLQINWIIQQSITYADRRIMYFWQWIRVVCILWELGNSYAQILLNKMNEKMKRLLYNDELHDNKRPALERRRSMISYVVHNNVIVT